MFNFFIDRPIFSSVISLIITLAGAVAALDLPITQYPQIVPPQVQVTTALPGANANVVTQAIAAPIEQQVNGAKNMIYMDSKSANDGTYSLTVTFDVGSGTLGDLAFSEVAGGATITLVISASAIGNIVVDSRLPARGTPQSDSYEGDGYVIVRHPDTEVVKQALVTAI